MEPIPYYVRDLIEDLKLFDPLDTVNIVSTPLPTNKTRDEATVYPLTNVKTIEAGSVGVISDELVTLPDTTDLLEGIIELLLECLPKDVKEVFEGPEGGLGAFDVALKRYLDANIY